MKFWLNLLYAPVAEMQHVAEAAEAAGFHGITFPDHACIPDQIGSHYPYGEVADRPGFSAEMEFPDPWVCIATMAQATKTVRFATHVLVAPLLHPFTLARSAATTALATGHRLDLGLGIGWMKEEFDAMQIDFRSRAGRTDECIQIVKALWTGQPVAWAGKHFSFPEVSLRPTPRVPIPIILGGESEPALRRAARFGDGWAGAKANMAELTAIVALLRKELDKADRDHSTFAIRARLREVPDARACEQLSALGVESAMIPVWLLPGATLGDRLETFARDVILAVNS